MELGVKWISVIVVGLSLLCGPVAAQPSREAHIADLTKQAESGQVDAQFRLAQSYHIGSFVSVDRAMARFWYERAAAQGDRRAKRILREFDPEEAVRQFHEDAKKEYPAAYLGLCEAYMSGVGVPSDPVKGLNYCRKSTDPEAIYWQAYAYDTGLGVGTDSALAARLYSQAANAGSGRAMTVLGLWALKGRGQTANATVALKLFQLAASYGDSNAIVHLAELYEKGLGTLVDPEEAIRLYVAAAERGVEAAKAWTKVHPDPLSMTTDEKAAASKKLVGTELYLIRKAEDGSEERSSFANFVQLQTLTQYPALASVGNVGGSATIDCRINALRRLDNCVLIYEAPLYYGFAKATLALYRHEIEMAEEGVKSREAAGFGRRFRTRLVWLMQ